MDLTTRLKLNKPDPDPVTGDFVDVVKLNDNADKIDGAISFTSCLSTGRPAVPFQGQAILETDTGKAYVWGGSAWLPLLLASSPIQLTANLGIGVAPNANTLRKLEMLSSGTNGTLSQMLLRQSGPATGSRALSTMGGADNQDHWWVDFDGSMQWGPGNAGGDTVLKRESTGQLRTTGDFSANRYMVNGSAARVMTQFYDHSLAGTDAASQWLKTTVTDCVGLTRTFTTLKANALAVVTFTGDFESRVGSAGTGVMMLNIDTVNLSIPQALFNGGNTTAGARSTCSQQAFITLASAGSHNIKARCQQATGVSDNIRLNNGHTTMNIQVFE